MKILLKNEYKIIINKASNVINNSDEFIRNNFSNIKDNILVDKLHSINNKNVYEIDLIYISFLDLDFK